MAYKIEIYCPGMKTKEAMQNAWLSGKDFKIVGGCWCSIRDYKDLQGLADHVIMRWLADGDKYFTRYTIWEHPLAGVTHYV